MKFAADFRGIARDALKGKWKIAVLVGLVAAILGAIEGIGPEVNLHIDGGSVDASLKFAGQTIFSTVNEMKSGLGAFLIGQFVYIFIAALIMAALYFVLGSVISVGYAKFNLNLVDRLDGSFENLFAYFSYWKVAVIARLLKTLYIVLGLILLVVPGILSYFNYAMTDYILAENPELSANEALRRSKEMMYGNRWRLFCLHFSFIGWHILASFTLGIGNLWLNPYIQAANTAFYREVSGTERLTNLWNEELLDVQL